jgi:hypothetical protein
VNSDSPVLSPIVDLSRLKLFFLKRARRKEDVSKIAFDLDVDNYN